MEWSCKVAAGGRGFARIATGTLRRVCGRILIAATLIALPRCMTSDVFAGPVRVGLFDTRELHSTNLAPFTKRRGMLTRFEREFAACRLVHCRLYEWQHLVASLRGRSEMAQLTLVNRTVNRYRYVDDWTSWDIADYWETPLQLFDRRSGDCEDFAVAKYLALRAVGIPADDMRVVVVNDHARHRMHAILAVYAGKRVLILDSLYDAIVDAAVIDHYEPIYSINERGWWLHRH